MAQHFTLRRKADGVEVELTREHADYLLSGGQFAPDDFESEWEQIDGPTGGKPQPLKVPGNAAEAVETVGKIETVAELDLFTDENRKGVLSAIAARREELAAAATLETPSEDGANEGDGEASPGGESGEGAEDAATVADAA